MRHNRGESGPAIVRSRRIARFYRLWRCNQSSVATLLQKRIGPTAHASRSSPSLCGRVDLEATRRSCARPSRSMARLPRIVGVLPANFEMPTLTPTDILVPEALDEEQQRRSAPGAVLRTFGRMKPGATVAEVIVGLQPFLEQSLQGAPPAFRKEIHLAVSTVRDRQVHDARLAPWILLGSVFAVLLVACTNVASLQLARATGRQRELAVRAALGASRGRLVRQAMVESTLLGLLGGTLGCWVAHLLLRLFVSIAPQGIPRLQQASVDLRVVGFTFAISMVSTTVFGLASALSNPAPGSLIGKVSSNDDAHCLAANAGGRADRGFADTAGVCRLAAAQLVESATRPNGNRR